MSLKLYGIKNCDTMKKARTWLEAHDLTYAFHDYKAQGIDEAHLKVWAAQVGWERLLNKAGTTFRALPETDRTDIDEAKALRLMQANPSMIKRPVMVRAGVVTVGFSPELYEGVFG